MVDFVVDFFSNTAVVAPPELIPNGVPGRTRSARSRLSNYILRYLDIPITLLAGALFRSFLRWLSHSIACSR